MSSSEHDKPATDGPDERADEQFVRRLTENQNRLYGYIYSLVGKHSQAADVLQETNLVLWRKIGEFDSTRPFLPWAFAIARFQVLAHLRDQKRDRLLLDPELAESLADEAATEANRLDAVRQSLRPCLQLLSASSRSLVEARYFRGRSVQEIAAELGRSVGAVKVALLRVRRRLADCVQRRLAMESGPTP